METLLFWALPVIVALAGLKGNLMPAWRLCFASVVAVYVGVWAAPAWWGLLDFLPPEAEPYRNGAATAAGVVALFAALYFGAKAIAMCDDEAFVFPAIPERLLNALCRFGFGVCLSTFLMLLCEITPLRMFTRNDGAGFEARAEAAMLAVTRAGDALTRTQPSQPREEALAGFRYVPPEPPDEEAGDEKGKKPEPSAASAAGAKKGKSAASAAGARKDKASAPAGNGK